MQPVSSRPEWNFTDPSLDRLTDDGSKDYVIRMKTVGNEKIFTAEKKGIWTWLKANVFCRNEYKLQRIAGMFSFAVCSNDSKIKDKVIDLSNHLIKRLETNNTEPYKDNHTENPTYQALRMLRSVRETIGRKNPFSENESSQNELP